MAAAPIRRAVGWAIPKLKNVGCTAEAAGSRPVVPAIHSQALTESTPISRGHKKAQNRYRKLSLARQSSRLLHFLWAQKRDAWVGGSSRLLAQLVEALRRHVLAAKKLHADDTPVPVLAPGIGKTKTGRLWTYVR